MKLTRFLNALYVRSAARSLLLPIVLVTVGCDDKFEVSIYKPDKICESDTPATHAAIDRHLCTGNPVKLLRGSTAISSSVK